MIKLAKIGWVGQGAVSGAPLEAAPEADADGLAVEVLEPGPSLGERLVQSRCRAVVLDASTLGARTLEVLASLRDPRTRPLPVLVLGEAGQESLFADALRMGASDFLVRPVDRAGLRQRLAVHLALAHDLARNTPASLMALGGGGRSEEYAQHCAQCQTIWERGAEVCGRCGAHAAGARQNIAGSEFPELGKVLVGRYLLDRYLDSGHHGAVYRARDLFVRRYYAVKFFDLFAEADAETRDRVQRTFTAEAEALAECQNPHLVRLYELHRLPSGAMFAVFDYVDGLTLLSLVARSGPLGVAQSLDVARQIGLGCHELHRRGFVNRDLKPANIMVEDVPLARRFVRLIDFGLATRLDAANLSESVYGTPMFCAPEQLLAGGVIDGRADIFALGAILYWMVTGSLPWARAAVPDLASMVALRRGPLPVDSLAAAGCKPGMVALLENLLAFRPEDRLPDMRAVVAAIDDVFAETRGGGV